MGNDVQHPVADHCGLDDDDMLNNEYFDVYYSYDFVPQVINYNYLYAMNLWILACPWWLCFDWSMGCIPLIRSTKDPRILAVLLMWSVVIGLLGYCLLTAPSRYRRYDHLNIFLHNWLTVLFDCILLISSSPVYPIISYYIST